LGGAHHGSASHHGGGHGQRHHADRHHAFAGFFGGYYSTYFGYPYSYYSPYYYDPYYYTPSYSNPSYYDPYYYDSPYPARYYDNDGYYPAQDEYDPSYDNKDDPENDRRFRQRKNPAREAEPERDESDTRHGDDSPAPTMLNLAYQTEDGSHSPPTETPEATDLTLSLPGENRAIQPPLISTQESPEILPAKR
jgi:hypothetical protein